MRNAGGKVAGGSSGRRQGSSSPDPAAAADAGAGAGASLFTPAYRVSHGTPGSPYGAGQAHPGTSAQAGRYSRPDPVTGYTRDYEANRDASWLGEGLSAGSGWGTDDPSAAAWPGGVPGGRGQGRRVASNAVRGFPPAPGEPLPLYPPGPFEAWNRGQEMAVAPRTGDSARAWAEQGMPITSATITPDEFDTDYSIPAIKDPIPGAVISASSVSAANSGTMLAAAGQAAGLDAGAGSSAAVTAARPTSRTLPGEPVRRSSAAGRTDSGSQPAARPVKTRPRRKRRSHWLAIALAIVIIAVVAGALYYTLPKTSTASPPAKPRPTSTPSATPTGPTKPPGQWGFIGTRKTDAIPLTMAEVFPATISDGTTSYTRVRQVAGKKCNAAVIGPALRAAVKAGGCNQALRATYLSKSAKVMGTIGVFNLKNAAKAGKAAAQAGHSLFVAQLTAKAGPAKSIGQGTGLEEALFKGHYLVLVWVEPTNVNASVSGKNKKKLNAFMNLLVAHTANVSLSYRMVDGKPPPAG